jgi:hypothetical protein
VAKVAQAKGVPTRVEFFGAESARTIAREQGRADLVLGKNVLAQVHDLNDFVAGFPRVLAPAGTLTIELPHVVRMIAENQFDTIYHEHFSYFSLYSAERIFAAHGITIFDVEELPTHGGSLRLYGRHSDTGDRPLSERLLELRARETAIGVATIEYYSTFEGRVRQTKHRLLELLIGLKREGKRIAGYGAPGKGNTLLNYCGIRTDLIDFTVDRSPYKQGKYLPGTRIPIYHPERIREARPDFVVILPWNIKDEILSQLAFIRDWGGRFVVPIPEPHVVA